MFELWVPITLFAAFMQNIRSALQKRLTGTLSVGGATLSRFLFAFPFAAAYAYVLHSLQGLPWPDIGPVFWLFCLLGGIAQIVATYLLVSLFSLRNFAVGTALSKTETLQAALFGLLILGETISLLASIAILIGLCGIIAFTVKQQTGEGMLRSVVVGLASGAAFGIAAVSYRAAALSLEGTGFLLQAACTLAVVTLVQTVIMSTWLRYKEPGQVLATIRAWRVSGPAAIAGVLASAGWFTAMAIQNVAYVRALGQIELIFTYIASHFLFGERQRPMEVVGVLLVTLSIIFILLG